MHGANTEAIDFTTFQILTVKWTKLMKIINPPWVKKVLNYHLLNAFQVGSSQIWTWGEGGM